MIPALAGFDGKLPSRGDFVGFGLPRSFLVPWQAWVDAALSTSRRTLGDGWSPAWLEAPVWRFALPAGACGPDPVLGLTMPSVDRAGRQYPLTVAAVFTGHQAAPSGEAWLDSVEVPALRALALDHPPGTLTAALGAVGEPAYTAGSAGWWTLGSPRVPPNRLPIGGLPAAAAFAAMIDAGGRA